MKRILLFTCLLPVIGLSQSRLPYIAQRLRGPIVLDGLSDEPAWQDIRPFPLTMHTPVYQGQPTEQTEIRVAYDDEYIYASARMYDSDPSAIQAYSIGRDADRGGDYFNVVLDTFNDKQSALDFTTTPAGNRNDGEILNDAEGSDPFNINWNSYWDCEVVQNEQGWFAEMRIPFSSLRFQDDHGHVAFGLIVHRLIGRKNERLTFPSIAPKRALSPFKPSEAQEVVFEGIYRRNPVYFSPYLVAGNTYDTQIQPDFSAFSTQQRISHDLGFDLKYGVTNNLTLDLTANTDFAQVESDDQQINLTRFSLFYPEKRQFFQERASIFDVRYAGINRMFHSRKVGLTDAGEPVRILGGARLVGRVGPWDLGILDMQTDRFGAQPSENFSVVRFRTNVVNNDSYVGFMHSGRFGTDGSHNVGLGVDGFFRLSDADYILLNLIQGFRTALTNRPLLDQSVMSVDWQRRTSQGFGGNLTALYVGDLYDPGLGFNQRNGGAELSGTALYGWFDDESPLIRKHTVSASWSTFLRNDNGMNESSSFGGGWKTEFKSGASVTIGGSTMYEVLRDPLTFSENVLVPPGQYPFHNVQALFAMSGANPLRATLYMENGTFYDGRRLSVKISPTWNISRYCELGGDYEFNRVDFPNRGQQLNANIVRLRVLGALNHSLSFSTLTQYNSVTNIVGNSLRVRYSFREGTDAYFVYNNGLWTNRHPHGLDLPALGHSTVMLKYVYTFSS